jgi:hypothetical protein
LERIDPEQAQFNWGLAGSMAYLHDIARPGELLGTGGYGISSTYNHGEEGRRMILEAELDLEGYPFTPEMIAVGVAHHSPRDVNGVSPELLPYIWLIRDADKLDNLLLVNGDYWAHLQSYAPHLVPSPAITPLVWRQFSDPRLVSIHNSHIRTFGDTLLFILGWFFELHFAETVEYLVRERVPERIFELMEDLGVEAVTIQEAKRVFSRQSGIQLREK